MNYELYAAQDCYGQNYMLGMEMIKQGLKPNNIIESYQISMKHYPESKPRLQEYVDTLEHCMEE